MTQTAEPAAPARRSDANAAPDRIDPSRSVVIWNPNSGRKAGVPTNRIDEEGLRSALRNAGLPERIVLRDDEAAARAAVREAVAEGLQVVVAAGGDGTVSLVADELLDTNVALGILPLGSAMNIGRSIDIPRDLEQAVAVLAEGRTRRIDVGMAEGKPFYEAVSLGMSAALFAEAHAFDRGRYQALLGLVRVLRQSRPTLFDLELDHRRVRERALMVTVANGPYTGLGFTLAPDARLDDGLFDVRIFESLSRRELVQHFWSIAFGRRSYQPRTRTLRAARVRVGGHLRFARADDRALGPPPVMLTVRPAALRVVAPISRS